MPSSEKWPLSTPKELAWSPGTLGSEIPLYPRETRISWDDYLDRLKTRLRWLRERSELENPNQWYQRQWMQKAGADVAVTRLEQHVDDPHFLVMLEEHGVTDEMFPMPVKHQEAAADAIRELDLTGWLEVFLPSHQL